MFPFASVLNPIVEDYLDKDMVRFQAYAKERMAGSKMAAPDTA